jgi:hypothetical protein
MLGFRTQEDSNYCPDPAGTLLFDSKNIKSPRQNLKDKLVPWARMATVTKHAAIHACPTQILGVPDRLGTGAMFSSAVAPDITVTTGTNHNNESLTSVNHSSRLLNTYNTQHTRASKGGEQGGTVRECQRRFRCFLTSTQTYQNGLRSCPINSWLSLQGHVCFTTTLTLRGGISVHFRHI